MQDFIRTLQRDERGATSIEYALIASLIAVVIVASVTVTGTSVKNIFNSVATSF
ncbi:MAG TPA: Flp family type IVb pilin [Stellaceae bacterium]|nr:Flp family type IVb pilin [Stellaceae bacterium]